MKRRLLAGLLAMTGFVAPALAGQDVKPSGPGAEAAKDRPLAELRRRFTAREKAFEDELTAANKLDQKARSKKITDENETFNRDWPAMANEARALIRAHPADPAAFDGIIMVSGLLRSYLDDRIIKIIRAHFLDDPRMGRLCATLEYRTDDATGDLLADVAARHPDRKVRGQATYALAMRSCSMSRGISTGGRRAESDHDPTLAEARRLFEKVAAEYADVNSADGTVRLADRARAELARIANLPNLKAGGVAPEIAGEDLDGKPMKLSDHRGKVVVVCFWATWCGPCMAMVPHERELVARMAGKPFILLGVNSDEARDRDKARKVAREKQMTWPSWWDGGHRGAIQTAYDVTHWPTVYVLDARGVIRHIDVRGKDLDRAVDALMSHMPATPGRGTAP